MSAARQYSMLPAAARAEVARLVREAGLAPAMAIGVVFSVLSACRGRKTCWIVNGKEKPHEYLHCQRV